MSGVEVAGLALGFLPLLISAAEHYDKCLRPFTHYKDFAKEANRFQNLLRVQKAIFTNQCRILLEEIIEHDVASSMLDGQSGVDHPSWSDVELAEELTRLLGLDSRDACITTIELIEDRLGDIDIESQDLATAIDQIPRVSYHGQVYYEEMLMTTGYLKPCWKQILEASRSQEAPLQLFKAATRPNPL